MKAIARCILLTLVTSLVPAVVRGQPRALLPIEFANSAEFGWLNKPVRARRTLDDMRDTAAWRFSGAGRLSFPEELRLDGMRALRVDMRLTTDAQSPTAGRLPAINLQRPVSGEDWREYNRLSFWIRAEASGFPTVPIQIVLHNDGAEKVPDRYDREGHHYVTLVRNGWQQVVWEIEPLARDRITMLEIGYFANKRLAAPGDRVALEIGRVELQRVDADHHTGWSVAPGRITYSHTGYQTGHSKTALANG